MEFFKLLYAYPDFQIAYLEEEALRKQGGDPRIFSSLIDGHSKCIPKTGRRQPKFRIDLPNPILGDGKSTNQNHAIIFYRGEYLQLIDANLARPQLCTVLKVTKSASLEQRKSPHRPNTPCTRPALTGARMRTPMYARYGIRLSRMPRARPSITTSLPAADLPDTTTAESVIEPTSVIVVEELKSIHVLVTPEIDVEDPPVANPSNRKYQPKARHPCLL